MDIQQTDTRDLITVPDLSAAELVAHAKKTLALHAPHPETDLETWDFIRDERGKTYEVQTGKLDRMFVLASKVREHFTDGFVGNTAAFVAWVIKHNPEGHYASFPEDDRLIRGVGFLCVPGFIRREPNMHMLSLHGVGDRRWGSHWIFVAFREVKPA